MKEQKLSGDEIAIEPVPITEIEACEQQIDIDWFPGDWTICTTRPSQ